MTPKEKANELYEKFNQSFSCMVEHGDTFTATKEMCYICIKEIISSCEYNNVESYNSDWWMKVKTEIDKL